PAGESLPQRGRPRHLGDIVIAYETAAREAIGESKPFAHHLAHLTVHGFLHLLGYDHDKDANAEKMERLERTILNAIGIPDPYAMGDAGGCRGAPVPPCPIPTRQVEPNRLAASRASRAATNAIFPSRCRARARLRARAARASLGVCCARCSAGRPDRSGPISRSCSARAPRARPASRPRKASCSRTSSRCAGSG